MTTPTSHYTFLCCCQGDYEIETRSSSCSRVALVALGALLLTAGFFIHFKVSIPYLTGLGTHAKWFFISGGILAFVGICIKKVQGSSRTDDYPTYRYSYTEWDLERLPTKDLNKVLPELKADEVGLIDPNRLNDEDFDLTQLTTAQIDALFPVNDVLKRMECESKLKKLSIRALDALLPKMSDALLAYIPEDFFKNSNFDWDLLSDRQVQSIFQGNTQRLKNLPIHQFNLIVAKLSDKQLELISSTILKNPDLDLSRLTEHQLCLVFPFRFFVTTISQVQPKALKTFGTKFSDQLLSSLEENTLKNMGLPPERMSKILEIQKEREEKKREAIKKALGF